MVSFEALHIDDMDASESRSSSGANLMAAALVSSTTTTSVNTPTHSSPALSPSPSSLLPTPPPERHEEEEEEGDASSATASKSATSPHHALKLFIGQIPRHVLEPEIHALFIPFGPIVDLSILRDKVTSAHRGCAFLTFEHPRSAEMAIAAVHEKLCLHNRPIVVRYAGSMHVPAECKLFVGMLSRTATEQTVLNLFVRFGKVKEVFLMRDSNKVSKGCAFIKLESREAAIQAISELHDQYQDPGAPRKLVVRFADSKSQKAAVQSRSAAAPAAAPICSTSVLPHPQLLQQQQQQQLQQQIQQQQRIQQQQQLLQQQLMQAASMGAVVMQPTMQPGQWGPATAQWNFFQLQQQQQQQHQQQQQQQQQSYVAGSNMSSNVPAQSITAAYHQQQQQQQQRASQSLSPPSSPFNLSPQLQQFYSFPPPLHPQQPQPQHSPSASVDYTAPSTPFLYAPPTASPSTLVSQGQAGYPDSSLSLMSLQAALAAQTASQLHVNATAAALAAFTSGMASGTGAGMYPSTSAGVIPAQQTPSAVVTGTNPLISHLFVHNLPERTSDADLFDLFSPFGSLLSARVLFDPSEGGASSGAKLGVVAYDAPLAAARAFQALNSLRIGNNQISISCKAEQPPPLHSQQSPPMSTAAALSSDASSRPAKSDPQPLSQSLVESHA